MNKTVATLGEVVDQVQDVVDEVPLGGNLEIRNGSVVDDQSTLLFVELQQTVHAAVLLELVGLGQDEDNTELVHLALLDEVIPLPEVLDNVTRHPRGEQSPWHQLLKSRYVLQVEVAEEDSVGQVDLVPVVRVQSCSLILRNLIVKHQLVNSFHSGLKC